MKETILLVHNYYQFAGGEDTVVSNEKRMLEEYGHKVVLFTKDNRELNSSIIKKVLLPFTTLWSWSSFFEVRRIIKKEKIDIVHCHNTLPLISPSVYYAALSMKVPVAQTVHNFRFVCPNAVFFCNGKICEKCYESNSFVPAVKNKCYRDSTLQTFVLSLMLRFHRIIGTYNRIFYIFLTDFNRKKFDKLINVDSDKVFVKPNFVEEIEYVQHNIDDTYVFAGRLDESKGIKILIEYWKKLPKSYILHIYGDGPLKEFVENNSSDNIKYMGFQNKEVIYKDMAKSTATVFPGMLYEGYPMSIAESLSVGCPVLSSNIGNSAEIVVSSGGGTVFDLGDVDSFVCAIEKVRSNNAKMRKNAHDYYEKYLNKKKNIVMLEEIYKKMSL